MRLYIILAGCIAFYVMSTAIGWTHGTKGSVARSGGYLVTAEYSDGEPMNYAEVKITSPDSDTPFQTGRTDLLGCFLFKPHSPGQWEIEVLDGMGHRLALKLIVDAENGSDTSSKNIETVTGSTKIFGKTVTGVSVIFGAFGILYGWRARRSINTAQKNDIE